MARRRRRLLALGALVVAAVAAAAIAYAILKSRTGNISHPNVEFTNERPGAKTSPAERFSWPLYGYTPDHLRYLNAAVAPPFDRVWSFNSHGLLEFPPVISRGALYQLNDNGVLNALNKDTGQRLWTRTLGALSASTPAVGGGVVYATVLRRSDGRGGLVAAMSAVDGRLLWQRDLPSGSESSPLLDGGTLYFGSQDGTVYALNAANGATRWTYKASGSVKGSPAEKGGMIFFGDYGGDVHALSAASGRPIWSASTSGALLGSGTFYAAPAVAFGRVYIGNTDGRMYSFAERSGKLAWAHQTGNYVYASAAVLNLPSLGPTVYVGSYDGTMYAFDARSGDVRWTYRAGGKISGSATIVGTIVYFADLASHTTIGLDTASGRRVFLYPRGSFDPVISDGKLLYLTGYSTIAAMRPAGGAHAAP